MPHPNLVTEKWRKSLICKDRPLHSVEVGLNKMLADTVKMIAYRAETALVALLLPHLKKEEDAWTLIRELLISSADIEPDSDAQTLSVRIRRMACPAHDKAIAAFLNDLTQLEFRHPETNARIIYTLA